MASSDIPCWRIRIKNEVTVCTIPSIEQLTTYVLLEQGDWFEDEIGFIRAVLAPESNCLDVGANHGVFALTIGKQLTTGHVWAFEPSLSPRRLLQQSIAENCLSNRVTLIEAGLSDRTRRARMGTSFNSELNSLHGNAGEGEEVQLFSLDEFLTQNDVSVPIDFVKLDVEGEEPNVLAGASEFLAYQSPLLMFEYKHGAEVNHGLIAQLQGFGYDVYRLLPDINVLVPVTGEPVDGYLLNLFACKRDRAAALSERGFLATAEDIELASPATCEIPELPGHAGWTDLLRELSLAQPNGAGAYLDAMRLTLRGYDRQLAAAVRVRCLIEAFNAIETMCSGESRLRLAQELLAIHLLHVLGRRERAIARTVELLRAPDRFAALEGLPVIPPTIRFLERPLPKGRADWIRLALREFFEYRRGFSSYFVPDSLAYLRTFAEHPGLGLEIEARLILCTKRAGSLEDLPKRRLAAFLRRTPNRSTWLEIVHGEAGRRKFGRWLGSRLGSLAYRMLQGVRSFRGDG